MTETISSHLPARTPVRTFRILAGQRRRFERNASIAIAALLTGEVLLAVLIFAMTQRATSTAAPNLLLPVPRVFPPEFPEPPAWGQYNEPQPRATTGC